MNRAVHILSGIGILALAACGCQSSHTTLEVQGTDVETFVEFMSPMTFEIESFTKPVSFSTRGNANGLEVVATTRDAAGDPVKVVGEFHIEMYKRRMGGGEQRGPLVESWVVQTNTAEGFLAHWERFGRFYRFVLRLKDEDLPQGMYVINGWINLPNGERVFADSFEFTHNGPPVPPVILDDA